MKQKEEGGMRELFSSFYRRLARTDLRFERYLAKEIKWNAHLIGIMGARGAGKTTLLMQHVLREFSKTPTCALYVSLDQLYFTTHSLLDLTEEFYKSGGMYLYIDEVHRYANWSAEIKQIYDNYPDLHVVFTGSSLLQIETGEADLSRRATMYYLNGMSFREFLAIENGIALPPYDLRVILENHVAIAADIVQRVRLLPAFRNYLKYGYYPFFVEDREMYPQKLLATFNQIIEQDLPSVVDIEYATTQRIKKLFALIAELVPLVPNISSLSRDLNTTRLSLLNYLYYLWRARAILMIDKQSVGLKPMAKPEKIYLGNTNYAYALADENANIGNVRETFFVSQLEVKHKITYSQTRADFLVDDRYTFEVGGVNKTTEQIKGTPDSFLALDNIEQGYGKEIPLWLFGFLY